jgi:O-antigen ligase
VGAYALAAGVPIRKYIDSGALLKLGTLCIVCASVLDLMTLAGVSVNTNLPLLPLSQFGSVGAETAALFLAIVAMCFMVRLASGPVRMRHVLALVPIVGCVLLADQRAVLVSFGIVVLVVVVGVIVGPRQGIARGFYITGGQVVLTVLALVAIAIVVVVAPAAIDRRAPQVPLASSAQSLFHNEAKVESAQDRLDLASSAEKLIPQHPIIGWGLGIEFQYYETGTRTVDMIAYVHNIVLDIWLRLGLIGLALFALALGDSIKGGLRVWWRDTNRVTASLALAIVGVLVGLFVTGLLEPLLDEYRYATLFGVSLGVLRACVTSMHERPRGPSRPLQVTPSRFAAGAGR